MYLSGEIRARRISPVLVGMLVKRDMHVILACVLILWEYRHANVQQAGLGSANYYRSFGGQVLVTECPKAAS